MNKVILMGRLGADPELRSTSGGTAVCNLRIATNEPRKNQDGTWGQHTEWHSVTVWGNRAKACADNLRSGRQVLVEGSIRTQKWQDSEGRDRYTTKVNASNVQFLGSKSGGSSSSAAPAAEDIPSDEIPF